MRPKSRNLKNNDKSQKKDWLKSSRLLYRLWKIFYPKA